MSDTKNLFPQFMHSATELRKFLQANDMFTILLKNGTIIHHHPEDAVKFRNWLQAHHIEDLRTSISKRSKGFPKK